MLYDSGVVMAKKLDLTGMRFGKLVAVSIAEKNKQGSYMWNFLCDCGNETQVAGSAVKFGNTLSCGCSKTDVLVERNTTHGMSKNPAYSNWKDMFRRCYNPNNKRYEHYHGRGIGVHEHFNHFPNFLAEIGEKPCDGQRWSVGRMDNDLSYQPNNIRWELDAQQARNHTMQANNTSGIVGVQLIVKVIAGREYESFVSHYNDLSGKKISKSFSTNKYGFEVAKQLATEFREKSMIMLQEQGADYGDSHGNKKEVL